MNGQIREVKLSADEANVNVAGTFDPLRRGVNSAKVLFLIVQGDGTGNTVIIEGEGEWKRDLANPTKPVEWTGEAENVGVYADKKDDPTRPKPKLTHHGDPKKDIVRGIAHGIAIHPAEEIPGSDGPKGPRFNPPQIEGLTWCVEVTLQV